MRLLIATACLIATPAMAQRVDTRVIDVQQYANGRENCRFNAVPDLHLTTGHLSTKGAFAEWAHKSRAGDGTAWLHARFQPDWGLGKIQMIEIPLTAKIEGAAAAILILDDKVSPVPVALTKVHPQSDRWTLVPEDGAALATAMRYTKILRVGLIDTDGKRLAAYEFWIGNLQDIAEYPSIIQWRCTPARGND